MVYLLVFTLIVGMFLSKIKRQQFQGFKSVQGLKDLSQMDGLDFEKYITALFEKMGYKAYTTQASGDYGADVIATKGAEKLCIQCKRYAAKVGIEAVQQAVSSLGYYKGTKAIVVTNSTYTDAAQILAKESKAVLIDGTDLNKLINKYMITRNIAES